MVQSKIFLNPLTSCLKRRNFWPVFQLIDEFQVIKNLLLPALHWGRAIISPFLTLSFGTVWMRGSHPFCMDSCRLLSLLDYGDRSNTPRQLGSADKTNVYRDSGEACFPPNRAGWAELSWLLARDHRTKGFLCCLRHGRPTGATEQWSAAQQSRSQRQSFTTKLPDDVCSLVSALDQTNWDSDWF